MELFKIIDTHTHMDDSQFDNNRKNILKEFFASSSNIMVTIINPTREISMEISKKIANLYPNLYMMIACHPHDAAKYTKKVEKRILSLLSHPKIIGIGEAGIDLHYEYSSYLDQKKIFERQIALAKEKEIPLLLHSRNAEKITLSILDKHKLNSSVIFHCFTGTKNDAYEIINRGYYLSFSGIITFKNAQDIKTILTNINEKHFFLETDSPYLSPEPFRGKANTPLNISLIYSAASKLKGIDIKDLAIQIEKNFKSVFKI